MQYQQWNLGNLSGAWLAPAFLGVLLILFGLLIFAFPDLLQYLIAAVLVFESLTVAGFTLVVAAGVILTEQLARRRFQAFVRLSAVFALLAAFFAFAVGGAFTVGRYSIGAITSVAALLLFISNLGELGAAARHRGRTREASKENPKG